MTSLGRVAEPSMDLMEIIIPAPSTDLRRKAILNKATLNRDRSETHIE
jgi:hypothetical protein